jgi:hypothetical protein
MKQSATWNLRRSLDGAKTGQPLTPATACPQWLTTMRHLVRQVEERVRANCSLVRSVNVTNPLLSVGES